MGIALVVISGLNRFSRLGLNEALIYNQHANVDRYLDTTWVMQIVRGIAIAAVVFLSAPFVADFFGEPRVTDLLKVLAVSPLVLGFHNPGAVYFDKNLEFHKKFAYRMSASAADFTLAVGYGLVYQNVWALVIGSVASSLTRVVASYGLHPYRPSLVFDVSKAKEMLSYGKWITVNTALGFVLTEGDDIIVGRLLGATALGYYKLAYRIGRVPTSEMSAVINDVVFAAYSKLQNDSAALRDAVLRTIQFVSFVSFPATVGLIIVAPLLIEVVLGEQWLRIVPVVRLLALDGLSRSITSILRRVWNAVGYPDYGTKISGVRLLIIGALIFPAIEWYGLEGVAIVLVVGRVAVMPVGLYLTRSLIQLRYWQFFGEIKYALATSLAMGATILLAQEVIRFQSSLVELVFTIGLGVITYSVLTLVADGIFEWGIVQNIQRALSSL
jgi:PST family polysaccharide transporter/lipopolysaccharide exporter